MIGISPEYHRKGIGKSFVLYIENYYKNNNLGCIMIVETSSMPEFINTNQFYEKKCNYILQGTIKDFYDDGNDKIIYSKRL